MGHDITIGFFGDGICGEKALAYFLGNEGKTFITVKFIVIRFCGNSEGIFRIADDMGVPIYRVENINTESFIAILKSYNADLFVVDSFDQIFRKKILDLPRFGVINCHSGKLPFYRGKCPIIWAIINGENEFGITVHFMDEGIDTGDIILQRTVEITDEDDYRTLSSKDAEICGEMVFEAVRLIAFGDLKTKKQSDIDEVGTYFGGREEGDELIKWTDSSRDIFNFVRALCEPGPIAATYRGNDRILINKVIEVPGAHKCKGICGQIVGKGKQGFYVKTGDTMIELIDYRLEGVKLRIGDRFSVK